MRTELAVLPVSASLLGCQPSHARAISGEPLSILDDPAWSVSGFSLSPDGKWAAVSLRSEQKPNFRLFVLDLDSDRKSEAISDSVARGQLLANDRPGMRAAEWTSQNGQTFRFPAGAVSAGRLLPNYDGGAAQHLPGVRTGSTAWFSVAIEDGNAGALTLDDSSAASTRIATLPEDVDPRLGLGATSKESFPLVDLEKGSSEIGRFEESGMLVSLATAVISPDDAWVGVTVARQAFGSQGPRGFVFSRDGSERFVLGERIYGPLQFRPGQREVYGISEAFTHGRADLVRWRY